MRLSGLLCRHRRGRTDRGPRCARRRSRRLRRGGSRSAALWSIDGLQIRGERPGRTRTGRVVLLQEQEQRKSEAALGKTACAAMTCRATVRKQLGGRFALIEILSVRPAADQHRHCANGEQTAPQFRYLHAPVALRRNRTALVMLKKSRRSQPRILIRLWSKNVKKAATRPVRTLSKPTKTGPSFMRILGCPTYRRWRCSRSHVWR